MLSIFSPYSYYNEFVRVPSPNLLFEALNRSFCCRMYRYAQVETALMAVSEVLEAGRGALRGRLKNFQRLGLLDESPGKGSRIEYRFSDVCLLALCLEFAQFGIDPTKIAQVKTRIWPHVAHVFESGHNGEDLFLAAWPFELVKTNADESYGPTDLGLTGAGQNAKRWVFKSSDIANVVEDRALLINLSSLKRRVVSALPAEQV